MASNCAPRSPQTGCYAVRSVDQSRCIGSCCSRYINDCLNRYRTPGGSSRRFSAGFACTLQQCRTLDILEIPLYKEVLQWVSFAPSDIRVVCYDDGDSVQL